MNYGGDLYPSSSVSRSDFESLDEKDHEKNNQLAFDVAEKEFGISPCMTGKEMSSVVEPDKLSMVMYLSQFYEMFKDTVPPGGERALLQLGSSSLGCNYSLSVFAVAQCLRL